MRLHAIPAYSRTYKTEAECLVDWHAGKDFKIACGPYFSIRDIAGIKAMGYREIHITELTFPAYSKLTVLITLE